MISRSAHILCCLLLVLISACATDITINPRACRTRAEWMVVPEDQFKYKDMFVPYRPEEKIEQRHFIKKITLMAPFSFFTPQEFMLRDILEDVGLSCDQVKSVGLTFKEGFWDILFNFIPPLSQITLILEGDLRGLDLDMGASSNSMDESDQMEDKDFDLK